MRDRAIEKVLSIAATGTLQFDSRDLDQLRTEKDISKPEYAKVIKNLNDIRFKNTGIKYAYIMRPTNDPRFFEFIADADSLDPYITGDVNGDGVVNDVDHLSPPGEKFDISKREYWKRAILEPISFLDEETQWGSFVTAGAPIKDSIGKTIGILGIDTALTNVTSTAYAQFPFAIWFFILLFLTLVLWLFITNQKFALKVITKFKMKKVIVMFLLCFEISLVIFLFFFLYKRQELIETNGKKLMAIASTTATTLNPDELNNIQKYSDIFSAAYMHIHDQLQKVRSRNPDIEFAYIFRVDKETGVWTWIADADTTPETPYFTDENANGPDTHDVNTYPGVSYVTPIENFDFSKPSYTKKFYSDQWSTFLSGFAPVYKNNKVIAVVGIDTNVSVVLEELRSNLKNEIFAAIGVMLLALAGLSIQKYLK